MKAPFQFRAVWPLVDETVPFEQIVAEARESVGQIAYYQRADLLGPGVWRVCRADTVPGLGNTTARVLVFDAPARQVPRTCDELTKLAARLGVPA